jgi:hypothetical protein
MTEDPPGPARPPLVPDTRVAHIARIQNYWRGGKDNFAVDREAGEQALRAYPDLVRSVRANRAFAVRAVRYLAGEAGIRQFLDIGPGIPAADGTHEVAVSVAPDARTVYVDNDPVVLAHVRALLATGPGGGCDCIGGDLRDPGALIGSVARLLDLSQPVAIMLVSVLHLVTDEDEPHRITDRLVEAVPPGSYLALTHVGADLEAEATARMAAGLNRAMSGRATPRTREQIERFFRGLELVEPGLVRVPRWRPDSPLAAASPSTQWGGVARKP